MKQLIIKTILMHITHFDSSRLKLTQQQGPLTTTPPPLNKKNKSTLSVFLTRFHHGAPFQSLVCYFTCTALSRFQMEQGQKQTEVVLLQQLIICKQSCCPKKVRGWCWQRRLCYFIGLS